MKTLFLSGYGTDLHIDNGLLGVAMVEAVQRSYQDWHGRMHRTQEDEDVGEMQPRNIV
jgi:hypothetical protein